MSAAPETSQISVRLTDGATYQLPAGSSAADLARLAGSSGPDEVIAAVVNDQEVDLTRPLPDGATVSLVTAGSPAGRHILRHSSAHVLAQAVLALWPGAHFAIGPAIEDGFYYDFELPGGARFTEDDLARIEDKMREIVAADQPFLREEHTIGEGLALFADQPYKTEIIEQVEALGDAQGAGGATTGPDDQPDAAEGVSGAGVSAYRNSQTFVDLCRGPHLPSTGRLRAFKLTRLAGAYWRGDERRPQLQRVYGTAWES
ncbi:MAG: TGS domain-containing protein, partial [Acidimicrobiales bacterium]|nr:TGS domain-containing protein [Acidimicrobiales bacterium]